MNHSDRICCSSRDDCGEQAIQLKGYPHRDSQIPNWLEIRTVNSAVSEVPKALTELDQLRGKDELTGLLTHQAFLSSLDIMLLLGRRNKLGVAVLVLNINNFRTFNNSLVFYIADLLLQEISSRLAHLLLPYNCLLGRLGNDEFSVAFFLPQEEPNTLESYGTLISDAIQAPFYIHGLCLQISAALGICSSHHQRDPEQLLRYAKEAMRTAKIQKSGLYTHRVEQKVPANNTMFLLEGLRKGLERKQFELHYQPKLNLRNSTIYGIEALIRWNHPTRGLLFPNSFIPAAEQSSCIHLLTDWVMRSSFRTWQALKLKGYILNIALNISVYNLYNPKLIGQLKKYLIQYDVNPQCVEIEVTETVLIHELNLVKKTLSAIQNLGVKISIDDFGKGYTTFSMLQDLPNDIIKVDRQLISNLVHDSRCRSLAELILKYAHVYNKKVVAEGVEDEKTLSILINKLNCDFAQGYYISKPLKFYQLLKFLKQNDTSVYESKSPFGRNKIFQSI